jgi:hypothetical protein
MVEPSRYTGYEDGSRGDAEAVCTRSRCVVYTTACRSGPVHSLLPSMLQAAARHKRRYRSNDRVEIVDIRSPVVPDPVEPPTVSNSGLSQDPRSRVEQGQSVRRPVTVTHHELFGMTGLELWSLVAIRIPRHIVIRPHSLQTTFHTHDHGNTLMFALEGIRMETKMIGNVPFRTTKDMEKRRAKLLRRTQ